jgi:cyclophilin family peptidyl-prolyl cis-trans isomerase
MFFNLKDNAPLDRMGFAPIGVVVQGMSVVDSIYSGYGETPDQTSLGNLGNSYLDRTFPKLDAIKSARIVK